MKILCFGELMGRFTPEGFGRIRSAGDYHLYFGGSEANVAASLATFGADAAFCSKFPANDLGEAALRSLRASGVDVSRVLRGGERLGLYFAERGASQRPSKVIYDRKHSAIATADPAEFDWETLLDGFTHLHLTGITPALSPACARMCADAAGTAKKKGISVSCDINFRSTLWSAEEAGATLSPLLPLFDLVVASEEHVRRLFGITTSPDYYDAAGDLCDAGYIDLAARFSAAFGIPAVSLTIRRTLSADDNIIAGMLSRGGEVAVSRSYRMHMVDRIGGGDSYTAGLLYALSEHMSVRDAVEFATAASVLKHSVEGDVNDATPTEVRALMNASHGAGRVER